MRRKDREVKNLEEIYDIMVRCDVCRIALFDEDAPYILPLNFGMRIDGGKVTLYFHGAADGKKYDLIKKNNRVSFEMDCSHKIVAENGMCTMEYESVIGKGNISEVAESEKIDALDEIMRHYHKEKFVYNLSALPATRVLKLDADSITAKRRFKK